MADMARLLGSILVEALKQSQNDSQAFKNSLGEVFGYTVKTAMNTDSVIIIDQLPQAHLPVESKSIIPDWAKSKHNKAIVIDNLVFYKDFATDLRHIDKRELEKSKIFMKLLNEGYIVTSSKEEAQVLDENGLAVSPVDAQHDVYRTATGPMAIEPFYSNSESVNIESKWNSEVTATPTKSGDLIEIDLTDELKRMPENIPKSLEEILKDPRNKVLKEKLDAMNQKTLNQTIKVKKPKTKKKG